MTLHVWAVWVGLLAAMGFAGACSSASTPPIAEVVPARVCWTLQRTIENVPVTVDTSYVPSKFEFEVTSTGTIVAAGTDIRGRWSAVHGDSVHAEWTEGRRRVWLFGAVRQGQFVGSGHVFTRFGATILVTYAGRRRACELERPPQSLIHTPARNDA